MQPCGFKESNLNLSPPDGVSEDQVRTIRVYRGGGEVISCWKLTASELAEINRTGRIYLRVMGPTMMPAHIQVHNPFEE